MKSSKMIHILIIITILLCLPIKARADFVFTTGQITLSGSTGQQTFDTGSGIVGKALILFGSSQTAEGTAGEVDGASFGVAVSATKRGAIGWGAQDTVNPSNTSRAIRAEVFHGVHGGGATRNAIDFVSFGTGGDAGKFTIDVTSADGAHKLYYIYIGGSDVTADLVQYAAKTDTTGTRNDTGASLGGNDVPDAALMFGGYSSTLTDQAIISNWIGFVRSDSKQWGIASGALDNTASTGNVKHYHSATTVVNGLDVNGTAIDYLAAHTEFIAGGQTLDWTDFATQASIYFTLYLKGGVWDAGNFASRTTNGTQDISTAAALSGAAFFSTQQITAMDTLGNEHGFMIGAGANPGTVKESVVAYKGEDSIATDENSTNASTKSIRILGPTVLAEADYSNQDADSFTVDWTTTDANEYRIFWFGGGPSISVANRRRLTVFGVGP